MTADVYAGDDSLTGTDGASGGLFSAVFFIQADAEVDVACRVANVLRLANRAPIRGSLETEGGERTTICIEIEGMSLSKAEFLLRKLSQLTCVARSEVRLTGGLPAAGPRVLRAVQEG